MPDDGTINWRELVDDATTRLGAALGGDRAQEARWIVERVSGYGAAELWANHDELVSTRAVAFFDALLARRAGGEPLQYVLGRWSFRTLELIVDRNVLIPRPETEVVAGLAIDAARAAQTRRSSAGAGHATVVDLGTGSGAIALSIAAEVEGVRVWGTDASSAALGVARANLAGLGGRAAPRIALVEGDWFAALPEDLRGAVDVLVSNPPYVPSDEVLPVEVAAWEPSSALFAGPAGTDDLERIIRDAGAWLAPGGTMVLEMGPQQTAWAAQQAEAAGFVDVRVFDDLAGKARGIVAVRP